MTVMAVERAGGKVAQGKVTSSTYDTYGTRVRRRPAPAARPARQPRDNSALRDRAATAGTAYAGQAAALRRQGKVAPGDRSYQSVLLAEFLAAVVILTLAPIASGGSVEAQAKQSLSPYATSDLTQLVAVGGVYFVLALASSGNSGRVSAWLGGLILIAIAMGKMAGGSFSAIFKPGVPGGVAQYGGDPFGTPGQGGVSGYGDTAGGAV